MKRNTFLKSLLLLPAAPKAIEVLADAGKETALRRKLAEKQLITSVTTTNAKKWVTVYPELRINGRDMQLAIERHERRNGKTQLQADLFLNSLS